jgi:uncharacterized protein
MGFDQYHEPPEELPADVRTFARMNTSMLEEVEAIGWYEQRMALEPDADARAIMADAQKEEFKHFSMDLEFLLRQKPQWREIAGRTLFKEGDIVANATVAEEGAGQEGGSGGSPAEAEEPSGSLGIGSLKGEAS